MNSNPRLIAHPALVVFLVLVVAGVLATAGAFGFMYSGLYDVSASSGHNPLVAWTLHKTYEQSLHRHARDVQVPPDLMTKTNVEAGARLYQSTCVECHGAPGHPPGPIGQGIVPPAPNLLGLTRRNNPQLMYWVIRNGVKMTAMPAFGKTEDEQKIWQLAAFLFKAHGISEKDYSALATVTIHNHDAGRVPGR